MTYTREQWEPAATEAAETAKKALEAMREAPTIEDGILAYQIVFQKTLIELRVELSDIERERDITITHLQQERDELREKLMAANGLSGAYYKLLVETEQERDRLRKALVAAKKFLDDDLPEKGLAMIDEALAQPEEKETT